MTEPQVIPSSWVYCWDCEKKKGTIPVVLGLDTIHRVCKRCFEKDWMNALHPQSCSCPHCINVWVIAENRGFL